MVLLARPATDSNIEDARRISGLASEQVFAAGALWLLESRRPAPEIDDRAESRPGSHVFHSLSALTQVENSAEEIVTSRFNVGVGVAFFRIFGLANKWRDFQHDMHSVPPGLGLMQCIVRSLQHRV